MGNNNSSKVVNISPIATTQHVALEDEQQTLIPISTPIVVKSTIDESTIRKRHPTIDTDVTVDHVETDITDDDLPTELRGNPETIKVAPAQELTIRNPETDVAQALTIRKPTINSFFKNAPDHNFEMIWCYGGLSDNSWWFMTQSDSEKLEQQYQTYLVDGSIYTHSNGFKYDFKNMLQHGDRNVRPICRLTRGKYDNFHQEYMHNIIARTRLWVCILKNNNKSWLFKSKNSYLIYQPKIQDQLNQSYIDFRENGGPSVTTIILNNGYKYTIDFDNMTQTNKTTGKSRNIDYINPSKSTNHEILGSFGFIYN